MSKSSFKIETKILPIFRQFLRIFLNTHITYLANNGATARITVAPITRITVDFATERIHWTRIQLFSAFVWSKNQRSLNSYLFFSHKYTYSSWNRRCARLYPTLPFAQRNKLLCNTLRKLALRTYAIKVWWVVFFSVG